MTSHVTVLVVDDEPPIRRSLAERLRLEGHDVVEAGSGLDALERVRTGADLVVLDCDLPDIDAVAVLRRFRERDPDSVLIVLARGATAVTAAGASRIGVYRFAKKPIDLDDLSLMASQLVETARLRRELRTLRLAQAQRYSFDRIVGESPSMIALKQRLHEAATRPASAVLLTGESGTGKDLAARVVHFNSDRAMRPFVTIDCSATPAPLLEAELFGTEGTGVPNTQQQGRGLLESAEGGTILLDAIGETVPGVQARLLRLLEENAFKRVGGSRDITADVRVIAATNRKLEELVKAGRFREELYARLSVLPIDLPALRTHREDVPSLISYYVDVYNPEFRKAVRGASLPALRALQGYGWPGNVRELRNAVELAMLRAESAWLEPCDFPVLGTNVQAANGILLPSEGVHLHELERSLVVQALERSAGNQTRAAALLGLNRDQMRYRIGKFSLTRGRVLGAASRSRVSGEKIASPLRKISS
jgi:two-component system, NtrC family, response regulator AtoC